MKFFLDGDEEFPTVTSTGAEDYFGGAWAFLDRPPHALPEAQCFNTLFAGYPYRSTRDATRDRFSAGKPNPNRSRRNLPPLSVPSSDTVNQKRGKRYVEKIHLD